MKFYVYKITNLVNEKVYIGKTNNIKKRWEKHLNIALYKNNGYSLLHKSINKYGSENFSIELIEKCLTENDAFDRETFWIKKLDSINPLVGMNLTNGGEGTSGFKWSEESKNKIMGPNNHNYGISLLKSTKNKISRKLSDKNNPFYGKKHTKEVVDFLKNREVSDEVKLKISEGCRGEKQWNAKFSNLDILNIRQMWDSNEYSQTEIAKQYGVKPNTINQIINRKRWAHI